MLSTTVPSYLNRAPVHLENIAKVANTQLSLTPNARLNNFVKEKAKFAFSGTSGLEPIPERPTTTSHSKDALKTRATLSRTSQSLNSLSSRRPIKTQESFGESSIVLDFMTEAGGDTNGFQKKAVIRPVQKLKTQYFYNSVYDVREEEEPMEARIKQLEQLYKSKAEETLWNTPPQQMMRNVLESYARVQPKGIIKQYLDYMQDKSDVQRIQRRNNRPSTSTMNSTRGNMKARTVENFFKDEQNQDKQAILHILRGPQRFQDLSKMSGKDVTETINDYCSTLENYNTLLMSVKDPQSLENFDDLLDETPEKSQQNNEKPFERWSEESGQKETDDMSIPKIQMNDYADIKEDASRKVRLIEFPAPSNLTKSASHLSKNAVNKINTVSKGNTGPLHSTFYASKTKAIAIIRQRPSTTGSNKRIPFKDALMNSLSVKNTNLKLEGKKALPEMLDNPYKFATPKAPQVTDNGTVPPKEEEQPVSPKTPNNWVLEGMTIQKSKQNAVEKKEELVFRRKGHINKQTRVSSAKKNTLISLMKRPNSENNASKRNNDRKNEFARADQSPTDLLNAWSSEENIVPAFRIKKIDGNFETQLIQEIL